MFSQEVNRILYIICIATAVFCRPSPSSDSNQNLTERIEKKKAGIRMMILILFIILCAFAFMCKMFDISSPSEQEFSEVIPSALSTSSPKPAVIVIDPVHDDEVRNDELENVFQTPKPAQHTLITPERVENI